MRGGLPNLIAGSVLAAAGGAIITIMSDFASESGETYAFAGIDYRLLLGVVIFAGLAIFGIGVFQRFRPPPANVKAARTDAQLIFRSMIALAGVNGDLHADELEMIQRCCQQFFRRNMSEDEIRKAFAVHQRANSTGFAFDGANETASPEARVFSFTAALMVARADGPVTETEQAKLEALATLLRLDEASQAKANEDAGRLFAKITEVG
jgi:hypothetical protein